MARGRARYQRGRVVATEAGGWEIHYNVYLTDPTTGKAKRHHRSRVVGYRPKMHRADAEKILAAELAASNGGPAGLAEAVDQEVLERNVARKTVIPEIEESEKPVLPVEMYAKLLAGLDGIRDRAIFLIACFCALRPSELFGLTWGCYSGSVFKIVNTAWRGRLQRRKIKRKNRYGRTNYRLVAIPQAVRHAIDLWRANCSNPDANALMFPGMQARARKPLATPIHPDNWLRLRLYPVAKKLQIAFHPTFQVLRRSFSTHGKKEAHPTEMQAQLGHSDIRTTLDIYTQISDPEVARMVNQVTNRILGLDGDAELASIQ